jgi:ABC-type polysaccharide/polyol phosphate export permease
MARVSTYLDLFRYRELFASLFRRDLRAKYKGSVLGVVWSLAHPLVLMGVYLVVFSLLLKIQTAQLDHYWLFLLAGLPAWVFFSTSLQSASRSLLENANLIRKVRFPRQLLPLSMVATQLVGFAVMLAIVIGLSLVYVPAARDTVWLAIPLAVLAACLVAGLSLAVASLNAVYRDVEHLVAALLLPWFFLTPVLYSLDDVPGVSDHPRLVDVVHYANFVTPAVEAVRDPIFFGELPAAGDAVYLVVSAVAALALGAWVFSRVDDRVAVEV